MYINVPKKVNIEENFKKTEKDQRNHTSSIQIHRYNPPVTCMYCKRTFVSHNICSYWNKSIKNKVLWNKNYKLLLLFSPISYKFFGGIHCLEPYEYVVYYYEH